MQTCIKTCVKWTSFVDSKYFQHATHTHNTHNLFRNCSIRFKHVRKPIQSGWFWTFSIILEIFSRKPLILCNFRFIQTCTNIYAKRSDLNNPDHFWKFYVKIKCFIIIRFIRIFLVPLTILSDSGYLKTIHIPSFPKSWKIFGRTSCPNNTICLSFLSQKLCVSRHVDIPLLTRWQQNINLLTG